MDVIIYLAGNLLRIYAVSRFVNCFFTELKVKNYILHIVYLLFFVVNSGTYLMFKLPIINLITNIIFIFGAILLYESKMSKKVLAVLFTYLICIATDVCADKLRAVLNLPIDTRETFGVVVSDMFMLIIANVVDKKNLYREEYHIDLLNKIILIFIPVASIAVEHYISVSGNGNSATIVSILMIFINLMVFLIFDNIVEMSYKIWQNSNFEMQNKAYERQLEIIKQNDENTAVLRHDLNNQIAILYELIDDNAKAKQHLQDMREHIKTKGNYSKSGNKNIDSFLNYKLGAFEKINCKIDCNITIPSDLEINSFEVAALLGNLLDNAFRAVEKTENPYLIFNMSYSKNVVKISMKNPYIDLIQKEDTFVTTKKDKENHGMGLKIIKDTLKKYDGEISVNTDNNVFSAEMYFFIK